MQLCIDAGNTNIKYALFRDRRLVHKEEATSFDRGLTAGLIWKYKPQKAIISSVRTLPPAWFNDLKKQVDTQILNDKTALPVKLDYKTPGTLGPDRIAVTVAAKRRYPGENTLIINAGTCITYDIVTGDGTYKGGAIAPGIEMRYKAMHEFTAKLPYVTNRKPVRITGKSTEESLNAGVLNHVCFEIDGAIDFYRSHYKKLNVLLTGGSGSFLAKRLKNSIFAAPDLVLTGLNEILLYNA
jgi:type III pantothenate kinase